MEVNTDSFLPYTAAYIDAGTYCTNVRMDNGIEFSAPHNCLHHNLHIGKYNSLADLLGIDIISGVDSKIIL